MVIVGVLILLVGVYALLSAVTGGTETSTESYSGITRVDLDLDNATVRITGRGDDVVVDQRITSGLVATSVRHEVAVRSTSAKTHRNPPKRGTRSRHHHGRAGPH